MMNFGMGPTPSNAKQARCRRASICANDSVHLGQKLLGARLGSALLKDDVPPGVEERDDRGVVEAALSVRAVADAKSGGELPHRVIVGTEQQPMAEIEPVPVRARVSAAPACRRPSRR